MLSALESPKLAGVRSSASTFSRGWDQDRAPFFREDHNLPDSELDDTPPAIPQAETGTGVVVELHPVQGEVLVSVGHGNTPYHAKVSVK